MPFPGNSLKRVKIYHESHNEDTGGCVYTCGQGDMGQLGLGEDKLEARKPSKVPNLPSNCIQVICGGVHSACLTVDGKVYTWGCNDDGALGRLSEPSQDNPHVADEYNAGRVKSAISHLKIVQISCGDSHTSALTDDGDVYIWGTFRNGNGNIGLLKGRRTERFPTKLKFPYTNEKPTVIKIASGSNHFCCLSSDGRLFTFGNWEHGQLSRDCEKEFEIVDNFNPENPDDSFLNGDGEHVEPEKTYEEKCLDLYLKPIAVELSNYIKFDDVWAGAYCTFARIKKTKEIYACGLNNYLQLNINPKSDNRLDNQNLIVKEFTKWKGIPGQNQLKMLFNHFYVNNIAAGEHHTIVSCTNGSLYSLGRYDYGRLGLGAITRDATVAEISPVFNSYDKKAIKIACSAASTLAISSDYKLYGWGMSDSCQIAFKEDKYEPTQMPLNGTCIDCAIGAQHSLFIAK